MLSPPPFFKKLSSIRLPDQNGGEEDDGISSGPAPTLAWMPELSFPPAPPHALGTSNLFSDTPSASPSPDPPVVPPLNELSTLPHNILALPFLPRLAPPADPDAIAQVKEALDVLPLDMRQQLWDQHFADMRAVIAKQKLEEIRLHAEMREKLEEAKRRNTEKNRKKAERKRAPRDVSPRPPRGEEGDAGSMPNAIRLELVGSGSAAPAPIDVDVESAGETTNRQDIAPALKRKANLTSIDSAQPKPPKKKVRLVEPLGERSPSIYPTPSSSPSLNATTPKEKETSQRMPLGIPPTPVSPARISLPSSSSSSPSPSPSAPKAAPKKSTIKAGPKPVPKPARKAKSRSVGRKPSSQTPGGAFPQELFDNSLDPDVLLDPEYNPNIKHLGLVSKGFNSCLHCRQLARKCTEARPRCSECIPSKNSHRGPCIYEIPRKGNKHKPFHKDPWVIQAELGGAYFGPSNSEEWPPKEYVDAVWERLEREEVGITRAEWEERKAREAKQVKAEKLRG
ncbi:hypothetical protein IAT38_000196 [Cryptococcus sp. DSM 104549]